MSPVADRAPHPAGDEPTPVGLRLALAVAGLGAYAWALLRGLNRVCSYAFAHWLLTWRQGFIKRGLVGTIVRPLLVDQPAAVIHERVTMMASVALAALSVAVLFAAWRIAMAPVGRLRWPLRLTVLAFLGSSAIVLAASTLGFFDHLLLLITLGGVELLRRGHRALPAVLCVIAVGIHEIFVLYGLPVVALGFLLARRPGGAPSGGVPSGGAPSRGAPSRGALSGGSPSGGGGGSAGLRDLGWLALPAIAVLALTVSASTIPEARILAVREDLVALRCLSAEQVTNAVFHLDHSFAENVALQKGKILRHLLDPTIARVAWPTALALMAAAQAVLHASRTLSGAGPSRGRRHALGACVAVVPLLPLLAHVFAWDATRFTHFVVMQAFATLYAVVRLGLGPDDAPPSVPAASGAGPRRLAIALWALAAWALVAPQLWRVPLMSGYVDGRGVVPLR